MAVTSVSGWWKKRQLKKHTKAPASEQPTEPPERTSEEPLAVGPRAQTPTPTSPGSPVSPPTSPSIHTTTTVNATAQMPVPAIVIESPTTVDTKYNQALGSEADEEEYVDKAPNPAAYRLTKPRTRPQNNSGWYSGSSPQNTGNSSGEAGSHGQGHGDGGNSSFASGGYAGGGFAGGFAGGGAGAW